MSIDVNSYNNKYNVPMQATGQSQPGGYPMQAIDAQSVQHAVDNSYLSNRVKASASTEEDNPLAKVGLTAASWYALSQAMDKFGPKCAGKYEDSVLGRLGAWGDKVQTKFTSTKVGQLCQKAYHKVDQGWNWLKGKSPVLKAISETPTKAEWGLARQTGEGLRGMLAADTHGLMDDFLKPISHSSQLEQFGYSQAQIDAFENTLKSMDNADKPLALLKEELKGLGVKSSVSDKLFDSSTKFAFSKSELKEIGVKPDVVDSLFGKSTAKTIGVDRAKLTSLGIDASKVDDIFKGKITTRANELVKGLKVRKMGFKNMKEYLDCAAKPYDNVDKIREALMRADDKMGVSIWRKNKAQGHLFGRYVSFQELRNKFIATTGKGNTTKLGRALPKALGWFLEGSTNRFAGGKIAVLMQAAIFGDMLYHVFKAPKGEKVKTFGDRFVNDFSYVFAAPLAYLAMHKVGGMKYAGLDKAGVEEYRKKLKAFNADANAAKFASKAEYKAAKKKLDDALNAGVKNPITKFFKKIGRFINVGNETRAAYKSTAKGNLNFLRKIPNFFKNCLGVPMRIAIPMMMIIPVIAKVCTKAAHAVLGRPTHSVLDEEETPAEEVAQDQANIVANQPQNNPSNNPFATPSDSPTNLINMYQNGEKYVPPTYSTTTTNINNVANNTQEVDASGARLEQKRTYIPSPEGVKVQGDDPTAANMAIQRSLAAEKLALETLAMQ